MPRPRRIGTIATCARSGDHRGPFISGSKLPRLRIDQRRIQYPPELRCVLETLVEFPGEVSDSGVPTADDILRRMADDPDFAEAMRSDPLRALQGVELSAAEVRRVEQVLFEVTQGTPRSSSLPSAASDWHPTTQAGRTR